MKKGTGFPLAWLLMQTVFATHLQRSNIMGSDTQGDVLRELRTLPWADIVAAFSCISLF